MVDRLLWEQEVASSNLVAPICRLAPASVFGQILSQQGVVIPLEAPPVKYTIIRRQPTTQIKSDRSRNENRLI